MFQGYFSVTAQK